MKRLLVLAFIVLGTVRWPARSSRAPGRTSTPWSKGRRAPVHRVRVALKVTRARRAAHAIEQAARSSRSSRQRLTIDAPAGVTVEEIVWPPSIDLVQAGADQPLSVFEREFLIGVHALGLADRLAPAISPSRRSSAIRRATRSCAIRPATADVAWVIHVVPRHRRGQPDPAHARDVREHQVRNGRKTGIAGDSRSPAAAPATTASVRRRQRRRGAARRLHDRGNRPAGTWARRDFLDVHSQRGSGRQDARPVRRPRAARHSASRAARRPRAQPDAVRPADDPDQPGDHRRGRAGAVARPGFPARHGIRRRHGCRLRRPRAHRHPDRRHVRHDQLVALVQPRHRGPVRRARPRDVRPPVHRLLEVLDALYRGAAAAEACCWRSRWARSRRCSRAPASRRSSSRSCCSRATSTRRGRRSRSRCRSVLGIGMAIPWPIAGAGIAALPKPGMWMVRVKQAFGVFILATAAYYGYSVVHALRESLGRSGRRRVERAGAAQGRLVLLAGRRAGRCEAREQAGPDRRVGDVVQELPRRWTGPRSRVTEVKARCPAT